MTQFTSAADLDAALHAEQACYWLGLIPEDREPTEEEYAELREVGTFVIQKHRDHEFIARLMR